MDKAALGDKLRVLRDRAGLSQQALADKSGVSRNAINNIEQGDANPTIETLESLGQVLGEPLVRLPGQERKDITPATLAAFFGRMANLPPHRMAVVLAIIHDDESYLSALSEEDADPTVASLLAMPKQRA